MNLGAKLITPFGLLGMLSTKRFKRRLREHYYRSEPTPGSYHTSRFETIRIEAFLRDFVIDLGPADVEDGLRPAKPEAQSPTIAEHAVCESEER